jgi:hypothetical protein
VVPGDLVALPGEADWLGSLAGLVCSPVSWVGLQEVTTRWRPNRKKAPGLKPKEFSERENHSSRLAEGEERNGRSMGLCRDCD